MKLALHGYGKMGRAVERVANEMGHEVVAIFDGHGSPPIADAEEKEGRWLLRTATLADDARLALVEQVLDADR